MESTPIQIHLIDPAAVPLDRARELLTPDEAARAAAFVFGKDAGHWSACCAAMRCILGDLLDMAAHLVPLRFSAAGKPLLPLPFHRLHFNLTHCEDLAILAVSPKIRVGVDLERTSRGKELIECMDYFCHPSEIASLPSNPEARARRLLEIWTAKEAVLKSLGLGLFRAPESLEIQFGETSAIGYCSTQLAGLEKERIRPIHHPALGHHTAMLSSASKAEFEFHIFHFLSAGLPGK